MNPIYQNQSYEIDDQPDKDNLVNPLATVYIISGDSGNNYFMDSECKYLLFHPFLTYIIL